MKHRATPDKKDLWTHRIRVLYSSVTATTFGFPKPNSMIIASGCKYHWWLSHLNLLLVKRRKHRVNWKARYELETILRYSQTMKMNLQQIKVKHTSGFAEHGHPRVKSESGRDKNKRQFLYSTNNIDQSELAITARLGSELPGTLKACYFTMLNLDYLRRQSTERAILMPSRRRCCLTESQVDRKWTTSFIYFFFFF